MTAPVRKRRLYLAGPVIVAALLVPGPASTAGTSVNPEITDVAGDANFINGQRGYTCLRPETCREPGAFPVPNPVPESLDALDLRAVWFETEYETTQVRDPATGDVVRVEHDPTALAIHIQTEAPAWPVPPEWAALRYDIPVTLPQCNAHFDLKMFASGSTQTQLAAGSPFSVVRPDCDLQKDPGQIDYRETFGSNVRPTFVGTVATFRFSLVECTSCGVQPVWRFIPVGTSIAPPYAFSQGSHQVAGNPGGLIADETAVGRGFTIGQDVPPDVDCSEEPDYAGCGG